MSEMKIALDILVSENDNIEKLLIANGTKDYHVNELDFTDVKLIEGDTRNSSIEVSINPSSILSKENGPWTVKYDRLPFVADDHPVIVITGQELSVNDHYTNIKNKLHPTRGVHAGAFDINGTLQEINNAFKDSTEEQLQSRVCFRNNQSLTYI